MTEKKKSRRGPVSLHPLKMEEALGAALAIKPKKNKRANREPK